MAEVPRIVCGVMQLASCSAVLFNCFFSTKRHAARLELGNITCRSPRRNFTQVSQQAVALGAVRAREFFNEVQVR
jgi:hypothetical protein